MEQRCLGFRILAEFVESIRAARLRLILLSLIPALGFVALFLLPGLLFLTFCETRSASWHPHLPDIDFRRSLIVADSQRCAHADTVFVPAVERVSADLFFMAVACSSARARFRRAIFCLRSRLNLDLSPFCADIMDSCRSAARRTVGHHETFEGETVAVSVLRGSLRGPLSEFPSMIGEETPPDLSIAKAQVAPWRIFEVK
jgi:hypothetical protein